MMNTAKLEHLDAQIRLFDDRMVSTEPLIVNFVIAAKFFLCGTHAAIPI
jgi:hypothetical protein